MKTSFEAELMAADRAPYPGPIAVDKHTCTHCKRVRQLVVGVSGQSLATQLYRHCPEDEGKETGRVLHDDPWPGSKY
jgi:hypothetical protein